MHGSTDVMAKALADGAMDGGMEVYFRPDADEREACCRTGLALAERVKRV
ncbi:MAG: hypothetical protein PHP59_09570 [Methanofollis sp.]|nr:hypothetical protein [Methanofollis sp.]MDD4255608.1 hypothetical protein [Methanofollis sp.]